MFTSSTMKQINEAISYTAKQADAFLSPEIKSMESRAPTREKAECPSPFIYLSTKEPKNNLHVLEDIVFNYQSDSKCTYKIVGTHYCCRRNYITRRTNSILKHMILSLIQHSNTISDYFKCIEYNIKEELNSHEKIMRRIDVIMTEFFKKIKHIHSPINLVYVVLNAKYLEKSFFLTLRKCKPYMPNYIRFIFGVKQEFTCIDGSTVIPIITGNYLPQLCKYICQQHIIDPDNAIEKSFIDRVDSDYYKLKAFSQKIIAEPSTKYPKEKIISILSEVQLYGKEKKRKGVAEIIKEIEKSDNKQTLEKIFAYLLITRNPVPLYLLEAWLNVTSPISVLISQFKNSFYLSNTEIGPDTIIGLKHIGIWKKSYQPLLNNTLLEAIIEHCWATIMHEGVIEIPEYYHLNAVHHYTALSNKESSNLFLTPQWMHSQIKTFCTFDILIEELTLLHSCNNDFNILLLRNHIYLLENIYTGREMDYPQFCAQLFSRFSNETNPLLQEIYLKFASEKKPFLRSPFPTLRENNSIHFIQDTLSPVTAVFFEENYLVFSTSLNMLWIFSAPSFELISQSYVKNGIMSLCYSQNGEFLLGESLNSIQLWSAFDKNNPKCVIEGHLDGTKLITYYDGNFFSIGGDNLILKGSITPFAITKKSSAFKSEIQNLLILKTEIPALFVVLNGGEIQMLDFEFNQLKNIDLGLTHLLSVKIVKENNQYQLMCSSTDGTIKFYDCSTLTQSNSYSVFRINQGKLLFVLYACSYIISIEKRKIRFFKLDSPFTIDEWHYLFKSDINIAKISQNGKYLIIADTNRKIIMFDLEKPVEQRFALDIPSHRPEIGINFILYSQGLTDQKPILLTCSSEREIKIWTRSTCKFIKKFDISTVASNNTYIIN